jgi:glutathione S-transferase
MGALVPLLRRPWPSPRLRPEARILVITLYDNAFSPFARKVRMVLEHKRLAFEVIDGLAPAGHARLAAVNPRVEVPVLQDGKLLVINSSHIVAYLEQRYPERPVYPSDPEERARALHWERLADTLLDAITHDVSNGGFGFHPGEEPPGLRDAAREDLAPVYTDLERVLADREFLCGALSIADLALFPHLTAVRSSTSRSTARPIRASSPGTSVFGGSTRAALTSTARRRFSVKAASLHAPSVSCGAAIGSSGCSPAASTSGSSNRSDAGGSPGRGADASCSRYSG